MSLMIWCIGKLREGQSPATILFKPWRQRCEIAVDLDIKMCGCDQETEIHINSLCRSD